MVAYVPANELDKSSTTLSPIWLLTRIKFKLVEVTRFPVTPLPKFKSPRNGFIFYILFHGTFLFEVTRLLVHRFMSRVTGIRLIDVIEVLY